MLRFFAVFLLICVGQVVRAQQFGTITTIEIEGNNVTKRKVIEREIPFQVGDSISQADFFAGSDLLNARLRSLGLFNRVEIELLIVEGDSLQYGLHISVVERWYIWPVPILENAEPNFNTWWQHKRLDRLNYGFDFLWNNFRGRNERIRLLVRQGFTEQLGLEYKIPDISNGKLLGLQFHSEYNRNREVNTHSFNNVRQFHKESDRFIKEEFHALAGVLKRFGNAQNEFNVSYHNIEVADTILKIQPDYLPDSANQLEYFELNYHIKIDHRDYLHYPLKGYMVETEISKKGLGLLQNEPDLLDLFGAVHYHKVIGIKWFAAAALMGKLNVLDAPPYRLQRGLGYQTRAVRGYEKTVMDGQSYGLLKTAVRYQLLSDSHVNLAFLKKDQFSESNAALYISAFFDAGYVRDKLYTTENPLSKELQFGYGIGLDFVTYYDKVARLEFSLNKFAEPGIFLHFTKPI